MEYSIIYNEPNYIIAVCICFCVWKRYHYIAVVLFTDEFILTELSISVPPGNVTKPLRNLTLGYKI